MTAPINLDLRNPAGVAHNGNPVLLALRFPSPQRGRGARGEGDRERVGSSSSCRIQPTSLALEAKMTQRVAPSHPQPLSRVGERGAEFSRKFWAEILLAFSWLLFFGTGPGILAQAKQADKPNEPLASTKPQPAANRQPQVQKVFAIKHAEVNAIGQTIRVFPVDVRENPKLRVIAISGPAALMPTIEDTIRRLDVPAPPTQNVELTVYLLLASDNGVGSVPPELEGVAKQLKTTFAFKGLHTIDTLVVRSRDKQSADVKGLAKFDPDIPNPSTYSFAYRAASILPDEKGRSIRLDGLRFGARVVVKQQSEASSSVVGYNAIDAGFSTDIDVREGQKVVVGKAAVGGTNTALILVITAKIL